MNSEKSGMLKWLTRLLVVIACVGAGEFFWRMAKQDFANHQLSRLSVECLIAIGILAAMVLVVYWRRTFQWQVWMAIALPFGFISGVLMLVVAPSEFSLGWTMAGFAVSTILLAFQYRWTHVVGLLLAGITLCLAPGHTLNWPEMGPIALFAVATVAAACCRGSWLESEEETFRREIDAEDLDLSEWDLLGLEIGEP